METLENFQCPTKWSIITIAGVPQSAEMESV